MEHKHTYWGRQIDSLAQELSKLAIACDIELGRPGLAERILKNDETVCGRSRNAWISRSRSGSANAFNRAEHFSADNTSFIACSYL